MKFTINKLILGLIIVAVGVLMLLKALNIVDISIFINGWYYIPIILAGLFIFFRKGGSNRFVGFILFFAGTSLFIAKQDWFISNIMDVIIIPLVVVFFGVYIIFFSFSKRKLPSTFKTSNFQKSYTAFFSGLEEDISECQNFSVTAVFGGIELDLSKCVLKEDLYIKSTALFAGIEITPPKNTKVVVNSLALFGYSGSSVNIAESEYVVYVDSLSIFAGFSVEKNKEN